MLMKDKGKAMSMSYVFLSLGSIGGGIVLAVNLYAWFVLGKARSVMFSAGWMHDWFPNYVVWLTMLAIGLAFWLGAKLRLRA